jgi:AcrR family transcriptional regulator
MDGAVTARQLPRGRHRLSHDEVVASQRARLLRAMADAVAEDGYAATTVATVLARSGVSRETFYQQFRDKEDCFLAAFDFCVEALLNAVNSAAAGPGGTDPAKRFDRALRVYLDVMASDAALARVFLVGAYGAGPAAVARRAAVFERFVDSIASLVAFDPSAHFSCEALVGAISSLVTTRVISGRIGELPELHGPILQIAGRLVPVLAGPTATRYGHAEDSQPKPL